MQGCHGKSPHSNLKIVTMRKDKPLYSMRSLACYLLALAIIIGNRHLGIEDSMPECALKSKVPAAAFVLAWGSLWHGVQLP